MRSNPLDIEGIDSEKVGVDIVGNAIRAVATLDQETGITFQFEIPSHVLPEGAFEVGPTTILEGDLFEDLVLDSATSDEDTIVTIAYNGMSVNNQGTATADLTITMDDEVYVYALYLTVQRRG